MSGKPGAPGSELLAAEAVPGLKQLTNTRLPLLSLHPPLPPHPPPSFELLSLSLSTCCTLFSSLFSFLLFSYFPSFLPSTRGSPWQCAGAGDRKWVSGSAQATGSGWLRCGCNLSPIAPTELLSALQLRLLTIDALDGINRINLISFSLDLF